MSKTTIRVNTETRKKVKVLAATLGFTMDNTISRATDCLSDLMKSGVTVK